MLDIFNEINLRKIVIKVFSLIQNLSPYTKDKNIVEVINNAVVFLQPCFAAKKELITIIYETKDVHKFFQNSLIHMHNKKIRQSIRDLIVNLCESQLENKSELRMFLLKLFIPELQKDHNSFSNYFEYFETADVIISISSKQDFHDIN